MSRMLLGLLFSGHDHHLNATNFALASVEWCKLYRGFWSGGRASSSGTVVGCFKGLACYLGCPLGLVTAVKSQGGC